MASKYISGIDGCYHNVVGLPVSLVYRLLKLL
ncbi:MAG: Maf family protein [Bryobacteraceae bacterium]